MPKLIAAALLSLLVAAALVGAASAQQAQRFTAMTCDAYKKELSSAITKTRREDATARAELEEAQRQQRAQGQQPVGQGYGMQEEPLPLPIRQYDVMARHRSAAEMACARRDYAEAINEYIQAFNAINVPIPARLPQPAP